MEDLILKLLEKLDTKIDRVDLRLANIETLDAVQNEQLKAHMERTALAEENIILLRKEFIPVKRDVWFAKKIAKGFFALLGIAGTLIALIKKVL